MRLFLMEVLDEQKNIIVRGLPWKRQPAGFMFRKSI